MENWITRLVALLCALGGCALLWMFGAFVAVPWHAGRLFSLAPNEMQVIGVSLVVGAGVTWGAVHLFALADREHSRRFYALIRGGVLIAALAAALAGVAWSLARIA